MRNKLRAWVGTEDNGLEPVTCTVRKPTMQPACEYDMVARYLGPFPNHCTTTRGIRGSCMVGSTQCVLIARKFKSSCIIHHSLFPGIHR